MDAQIELRQHVWKRNGVAVWAGACLLYTSVSEHFENNEAGENIFTYYNKVNNVDVYKRQLLC